MILFEEASRLGRKTGSMRSADGGCDRIALYIVILYARLVRPADQSSEAAL